MSIDDPLPHLLTDPEARVVDHYSRAGTDAFAVLDLVVERRMKRGLTTIVDSLGLDPKQRARWTEAARHHGRPAHAVAFDTPAKECRARNKARDHPVPSKALTGQLYIAVLVARLVALHIMHSREESAGRNAGGPKS